MKKEEENLKKKLAEQIELEKKMSEGGVVFPEMSKPV
jgi:hypothetical protein